MVTKYGMSDKLGPIQYGSSDSDEIFLGRDFGHTVNYSNEIAKEIDSEVRALIAEAYKKAGSILSQHVDKLHEVAKYLIENEKMSGAKFEKIMKGDVIDTGYGGRVKWVGVCSHAAGAAVTENRKEATVFAAGSYQTVTYCRYCKKELSRRTVSIAKLRPTIKLSAQKKKLKTGKTYKLKVSGLARGDSVKSFKSSKKSVASVSKKGKIKALKKGKAVITVTLNSGKTAKCKITVK